MVRRRQHKMSFKQPIFELVRRCIRLPERVYRHLHFEGVVTVPLGSSRSFKIRHYGYLVENDLFWAGYGNGWEGTSLKLWARLVPYARTIFDIGSNTGVYALAARTINPEACVFAFEPLVRIAQRLEDNVALNGFDIEVVVAGASETTGETIIYEPMTEHAYSASLNPDMLAGTQDLAQTQIEIVRMDDFIAGKKITSADLFKIDTEMHECEVLRGFGDIISRLRPAFLIEVLTPALGQEVERFFEGLGYVFFEIVEGRGVHRVNRLGTCERNYLVCTQEFGARAGLGERISHEDL